MEAAILAIESYLPGVPVSNAELAAEYPEWDVGRIAAKTGIEQRFLASADECASDLACAAAEKLFSGGACKPGDVDYLLFCTQSPDHFLPTTACLLQQRLALHNSVGALDFNLGCSGYIYGLGLVHGLISTGQARRVLLLTGETYSKFIEPGDRSSATIFGDGGTATLIGSMDARAPRHTASYVYGTDGTGAPHLIVPGGAMRARGSGIAGSLGEGNSPFLYMNGPEIFHFALRVVPNCVAELLEKAGKRMEDVDLFIFHQANRYMLDNLQKKLQIPEEKFYISLSTCGNTVSGTIPIALESALAAGRLRRGQSVMLVGFGVGLSWAATLLSWPFLGTTHTPGMSMDG